MLSIALGLLTSRIGLAAIALIAALSWHYIDKAAAVRSAERELADRVQIETLTAQRNELQRRVQVSQRAQHELAREVRHANEATLKAQKEIEDYAATTAQNHDCIVDDTLLGRLRNR